MNGARLRWVISIGLLVLVGCPSGAERGDPVSHDPAHILGVRGVDAGAEAGPTDFFAVTDFSPAPRRTRRDPNDQREPVRENLDRAARSILAGHGDVAVPSTHWDRVKPPRHLDIVERRFAFVADWFTSSNANAVVYAGASEPRLGFFVVDVGGEPRIMVGPVSRHRRREDRGAARALGEARSRAASARPTHPWAECRRSRGTRWRSSGAASTLLDPPRHGGSSL